MNKYLEKLHKNQISFPKEHESFLRNLFYMVDSLKDEEEIRLNIYGGYEKYRNCVESLRLKGITFNVQWERDGQGFKEVAHHAVIKPNVLLAQLERYCVE